MTAPELSPEEAAIVARFNAAPVPPEVAVAAWEARRQRDDCAPHCMAPFGSHHPRCPALTSRAPAPETYTWQVHEVPVPVSGDVQRELAQALADELTGWPIGSGYYATTVGSDDAREMAERLLPLIADAGAVE